MPEGAHPQMIVVPLPHLCTGATLPLHCTTLISPPPSSAYPRTRQCHGHRAFERNRQHHGFTGDGDDSDGGGAGGRGGDGS